MSSDRIKTTGLAITLEQRETILEIGFPYGLYPSLLTLLVLSNWRSKIDPSIIPWFSQHLVGGHQSVCKITGHTEQLYNWFRQIYPKATGRALIEVGIQTVKDLQAQGHSLDTIVMLAKEERDTIWGL